ncbi:MAG TPA: hypothetical protein VHP58_05205 [Alphaproteobacteria bacterium]|nr:hypothetical protein [Alphaproteobacteria bacterium]
MFNFGPNEYWAIGMLVVVGGMLVESFTTGWLNPTSHHYKKRPKIE